MKLSQLLDEILRLGVCLHLVFVHQNVLENGFLYPLCHKGYLTTQMISHVHRIINTQALSHVTHEHNLNIHTFLVYIKEECHKRLRNAGNQLLIGRAFYPKDFYFHQQRCESIKSRIWN